MVKRFSKKWWTRHFGGSWHEPLGRPECPFAYRWHAKLGAFSLRLHHWIGSDDPRYHHDHGWWFITFVLKGGYDDVTPSGEGHKRESLRVPAIRFRPSTHIHTVESHEGGAWTLLLTGPHVREWGYHVGKKFVRASRYFRRHGVHPCD